MFLRDDLDCYPARFATPDTAAFLDTECVNGKVCGPTVILSSPKQYECHVTIEPVFDQLLEDVKAIAEAHGFRVADLIFQKRSEDTPERSSRDTFMTRNTVSGEGYNELITSAMKLRDYLENGLHVKVWRIKVEEILFDRRYHRTYQ